MPKPNSHGNHAFATRDDITDTLGELDRYEVAGDYVTASNNG